MGKHSYAAGYRYVEYRGLEHPRLGDVPGAEGYQEQREAAYRSVFGDYESVSHEAIPLVPHVDIYAFPSIRGGYTLVTGGMSDLRMTIPGDCGNQWRPDGGNEFARAELLLYVAKPSAAHFHLLRFLAHLPHDNGTWLGWGHTVPNGDPPGALFAASPLTCVLLVYPEASPESGFRHRLALAGDPVNLLLAIPITTDECEYKLRHGTQQLLGLLAESGMPSELDECRRSILGGPGRSL